MSVLVWSGEEALKQVKARDRSQQKNAKEQSGQRRRRLHSEFFLCFSFCFFPSSSWRLPGGTDIIHNPGHWLPDPWPQMEANLSKSWGGWCSHLQWYSDEVICSDTQVSIHHHGPWSRGIQGLGESLASDAPEATREWLCCSSSWCGEHQVCLTREHQRPPQATSEWVTLLYIHYWVSNVWRPIWNLHWISDLVKLHAKWMTAPATLLLLQDVEQCIPAAQCSSDEWMISSDTSFVMWESACVYSEGISCSDPSEW